MNLVGRDVCMYFLGKLSSFLGTPDLLPFADELLTDEEPRHELESAVKDVAFFRRKSWKSVFEFGLYRLALYSLVRAEKPNIFIETGVLHGITTTFTLSAFKRNGTGKLFSVDLPSYAETGPANQDGYTDTLPPGREPGWAIAQRYRAQWTLHVGRSVDVLPRIFPPNRTLDMFLHDSEHTYETMQAELRLAWAQLRPDGLLICDNIDANDAFRDFTREQEVEALLLPEAIDPIHDVTHHRFGVVRKKGG